MKRPMSMKNPRELQSQRVRQKAVFMAWREAAWESLVNHSFVVIQHGFGVFKLLTSSCVDNGCAKYFE